MNEHRPLTGEQVVSVYRQVLGRTPSDAEIEAQVASGVDLDGLLRVALDSEEYRYLLREAGAAVARDRALVNIWHPQLAAFGTPVGTRSEDNIAIVGRDGSLFLCGGSNANLPQYTGRLTMEPNWLEEWRQITAGRREEMSAIGAANALMVVPDKLAVYEERYPEPLEKVGPRPVERLLEVAELELIYPVEELRDGAAEADVYLPTDTHLTFRGNELLFRAVTRPLGIESVPDFSDLPMNSYPIYGDLGLKFDPRIVSITTEPGTLAAAEIVADNRAEIEAVGGHVGTRRVFRNDSAPDRRVAVLFGDSFGFSAPFYQGISWFMAQVFREVHFVWVPFGWDPDYVREVGAEAVLVQGAERFAGRVPTPRSVTRELAEETLRRKGTVEEETVVDA